MILCIFPAKKKLKLTSMIELQKSVPNAWRVNEFISLYSVRLVVSKSFSFILPDTWKVVNGIKSIIAALLYKRGHSYDSASFVIPRRPSPVQRLTLPSVIHCCQHRTNTIFTPIWIGMYLFNQPVPLYMTDNCLYCLRSRLRGIFSHGVYPSH